MKITSHYPPDALSIKFSAQTILIRTIPIKNTNNPNLLFELILLPLNSKYPISKFVNAHRMFIKGEDSPFPGGLANGVGKAFPDIPFTKCGTTFVKNTPAKNPAT